MIYYGNFYSEEYQCRHRCHHICHRSPGHSLHLSQIDSDFGVRRLALFIKKSHRDLPIKVRSYQPHEHFLHLQEQPRNSPSDVPATGFGPEKTTSVQVTYSCHPQYLKSNCEQETLHILNDSR